MHRKLFFFYNLYTNYIILADTTRLLNRVNGIIAGTFGLVANIVLIVLILYSKIKSFRKVFLQIAVIDIILLLITAAVEPVRLYRVFSLIQICRDKIYKTEKSKKNYFCIVKFCSSRHS